MSAIRSDRMNEEMRKVISEVIRDMKDPRISPMTTIIQTEVTKDLKYAKVRVSVYDEDETARTATVDALNHAAGFIIREVGQRMQIRALPRLTFILDNSIAYSVHISKILDDLHKDEKG